MQKTRSKRLDWVIRKFISKVGNINRSSLGTEWRGSEYRISFLWGTVSHGGCLHSLACCRCADTDILGGDKGDGWFHDRWQIAGAYGVMEARLGNWCYFERGQAGKGESRLSRDERDGWAWIAQGRLECDGRSHDKRCNKGGSPPLRCRCTAARSPATMLLRCHTWARLKT